LKKNDGSQLCSIAYKNQNRYPMTYFLCLVDILIKENKEN